MHIQQSETNVPPVTAKTDTITLFQSGSTYSGRTPMNAPLSSVLQFVLLALSSIFFLVDPFAAIPTFLAITDGVETARRRRMARRAAWSCLLVLTAFAFAGSMIFKIFGITLPAFKIAGGIILLLIGIEMLQARRSGTKESPSEASEAAAKEDAGIIPLGIPMLAGPGAISTVMVLMGESSHGWQRLIVYASILLTSFVSYLVLAAADRVRVVLGETGIRILTRLMGLLLTAIAVQFVLNGLSRYWADQGGEWAGLSTQGWCAANFTQRSWRRRAAIGSGLRAVSSKASYSDRKGSLTLSFIQRGEGTPRPHGKLHVKRIVGCQAMLAAKRLNVLDHPLQGSVVECGAQGAKVFEESLCFVG